MNDAGTYPVAYLFPVNKKAIGSKNPWYGLNILHLPGCFFIGVFMAVTDQHPQYIAAKKSWQVMQDAVAGEESIKSATTQYLSKSAGMVEAEKQGDLTGEI